MFEDLPDFHSPHALLPVPVDFPVPEPLEVQLLGEANAAALAYFRVIGFEPTPEAVTSFASTYETGERLAAEGGPESKLRYLTQINSSRRNTITQLSQGQFDFTQFDQTTLPSAPGFYEPIQTTLSNGVDSVTGQATGLTPGPLPGVEPGGATGGNVSLGGVIGTTGVSPGATTDPVQDFIDDLARQQQEQAQLQADIGRTVVDDQIARARQNIERLAIDRNASVGDVLFNYNQAVGLTNEQFANRGLGYSGFRNQTNALTLRDALRDITSIDNQINDSFTQTVDSARIDPLGLFDDQAALASDFDQLAAGLGLQL